MKKLYSVFILILLVSLFPQSLSPQRNLKILSTVILDAGHGGKDPGAIGVNKTYEKDLNLKITLKVKELLL